MADQVTCAALAFTCPSPPSSTSPSLSALRHGESEYNTVGKIGGDSMLSERGDRYSRSLPAALISRLPQVSPMAKALRWAATGRNRGMLRCVAFK